MVIPFITELNKYINQRNSKISEKRALIDDLNKQLQSKNEEISNVEEEYKQTFDDKLFNNLIQCKKDADNIQEDINKISEILNLMEIGQFKYDPAILEREIDDYVEKSGFTDLKNLISDSKEKYFDAIKTYENSINGLQSLKTALDAMKDNIPEDLRNKIINILREKQKEIWYPNNIFMDTDKLKNLMFRLNSEINQLTLRNSHTL